MHAPVLRLFVAVGLGLLVGACSKKGTTAEYGTLECLDGWPAQPTGGVVPSLTVTPSIVWQFDQGAASPLQPGVALHDDRVIISGGASWAALDRRTGQVLTTQRTTPGNYFLGAPVVDSQSRIYAQSLLTLYAYNADGSTRWTSTLDTPKSAEPESGAFVPTLIDDRTLLVRGPKDDLALTVDNKPLWNTAGVPLFAVGHWGVGYNGKVSFLTDLRTTKPAGRMVDAKGRDVVFMTVLGGRGIIAAVHEASGFRFLLLDTCGRQVWSTAIFEGSEVAGGRAVVGPGEITYAQIFHTDGAANQTKPPDIIAIDPGGQIIAGPISRKETPWLVGGDGTVYVVEFRSERTSSTLVALSPSLEQRWTLEVPAEFVTYSAAALSDDGILYAQGHSKVVAVQTTSPGLARSSWPAPRHDNRSTNWGGGQF